MEDNLDRLLLEGDINRLVTEIGIKKFLLASLDKFPSYFWTAPASVGKYHYPDEREKGGLLLHTRRVLKLVEHMVRCENLNYYQQDILVASGVLHDSFARGIPPRHLTESDPYHPLYVPQELPFKLFGDRFIVDEKVYDEIMECVVSHSGRWSVTKILDSHKRLPKIFQTIDYIASRDFIKIEL